MTDWRVVCGDCLEQMKGIPDGSIDLILTDLPYGTTSCKWDSVIPFAPLWEQYKRIAKPTTAIVLTASQPFTTDLINSNREMFKYCLVWEKTRPVDFLNAKNKPMKMHEDICIFSGGTTANGSDRKMIYNPQMEPGKAYTHSHRTDRRVGFVDKGSRTPLSTAMGVYSEERYPSSIIRVSNGNNNSEHPTQKPVALMSYLIRTYSNPGGLVLDSCAGSFTTGVACIETGRNFIGIEQDAGYCEVGRRRLQDARLPLL